MVSGGLGAFGALHSVCHYTCQGVVALLAIVGVSIAGMPLGFLTNPWLVVLFSSTGLVSALVTLRALRNYSPRPPVRWYRRAGVRRALLAAVAVVSVFSLALGGRDLLTGDAPETDGGPRLVPVVESQDVGEVKVSARYLGEVGGELRFSISMDTNDMDAPSLQAQDPKATAALLVAGTHVSARSWEVHEVGHMGHHVSGELAFPARIDDRPTIDARTSDVVLRLTDPASGELRWRVARPGS